MKDSIITQFIYKQQIAKVRINRQPHNIMSVLSVAVILIRISVNENRTIKSVT